MDIIISFVYIFKEKNHSKPYFLCPGKGGDGEMSGRSRRERLNPPYANKKKD